MTNSVEFAMLHLQYDKHEKLMIENERFPRFFSAITANGINPSHYPFSAVYKLGRLKLP